MNSSDIIALAALVFSLATFGYTVWRDRKMDARVKQVESEQDREKEDAKRRQSVASSPFFYPSDDLENSYTTTSPHGMNSWHLMDQRLLSAYKQEIGDKVPNGERIGIVLGVSGGNARRLAIGGEIEDVHLERSSERLGRVILSYPYSRDQHGNLQKIAFSFETEDGYHFDHTYETRHGHFEFRRIDPA